MSNTTLPLTGAISDYYLAYGFREAGVLAELRAATAKLGGDANMQIAPEQGAFMGMIAALMDAKAILEIGTFTGYSSLVMALASHAQITCVDVSEKFTAMARIYWAKAGVADRIALRLDGGAVAIADLIAQGKTATFDLCFIDADKPSYDAYYEGALKLLRTGGVVMIDNVLWGGDVANPDKHDADTVALRTLNDKIKADARVEMVMVPIGDGLTMVRKL
jgi:predicted O-methyltransferase YrrM